MARQVLSAACVWHTRLLTTSLFAYAASASVQAQSNAGISASQGLSQVVVNGTPLQEIVIPTDASVTSVFGTDLSVANTPRSVTKLTPELLKDADVRNVQDFVKLAPSTYTTDQFGGANVPTIRGQPAEVFQNGIQRTTRADGQPLSFNNVESIDVVNGPASSVYGPTANTGGYINLVTKRPYFDGFHGTTDFTAGYFDTYRWQEDIGGPLIPDKLAFRASYEGENSRSYYRFQHTESHDFYLALNYIPNDRIRFDFNTEFFVVDYNENTGWNRPTQDLIDNGQYLTGEPPGGPQFLGVINPTGKVKLDRSVGLVAPSDRDYGKNFDVQLDTTIQLADNVTLINRIYYEYYLQRQVEYAQRYYNLIDPSNVVQDRLELHVDFDLPVPWASARGVPAPPAPPAPDGKNTKSVRLPREETAVWKNNLVTGFAFKYVGITAYQDFFNEYLNGTDLTEDPTLYPITTNLFGVRPVPGTNAFATPAVAYNAIYPNSQPGTLRESAYEASYFLQDFIRFTDRWSLLFGGRLDLINDDVSDPIAPPGFAPAGDSTSQLLGSANASLTFKPLPWVTTYGTFSFNESTQGSNGGGFAHLTGLGNGVGRLSSSNYHYDNFLYEGGIKLDLFNKRLFVGIDGYYQEHGTVSAFGAPESTRNTGAELVMTYQPDRHFYATVSASYLDAVVVDPASSEFTRNVYDAFAPPSGTGVGSPNFIPYAPGHYREGGLPHWIVSGQARYKLDCGLGASFGFVVTDPIPTSELGNVKIPWQYELDAALFYETKHFEARLNFFNLTDEKNFSTGGFLAGTGNDLVTPRLPFRIEGTVAFKF